jgi:predicted nucleic acid-binding protein
LDTNIVSEVSKKRPSGKVLNFIQANEPQCVVPAIVVAERYHGAHIAPPDQRAAMLKAVRDFRSEFVDRILPFDAEAAATWGDMWPDPRSETGLVPTRIRRSPPSR